MCPHERMGAMQHIKRALARGGHFIPHLFVAAEALILVSKVQTMGRPSLAAQFQASGSVIDWLIPLAAVAVLAIAFTAGFIFHDRHCAICERHRREPRYSRILMTLGRPWWTVRGFRWYGWVVIMGMMALGFWFNWAMVIHYVLMAGFWLGFIGYLRIGAGRVGEGQPVPST